MEHSSNLLSLSPVRIAVLLGLAGAVQTSFGQADYDPGWTKNFRVGAVSGFNIKGSFSLNGTFPVSGNNPGPTGVSGVDHIYDDGYVRVDQTGNAQGLTTYWGYENAGQYEAGPQRMLFHSATSFTGQGSSSANNDFSIGAELAYGGVIRRWERTRLGWEFGFGWLPTEISDSSPFGALIGNDTYAHALGTVIPPGAPYQGGSSGVGAPSISDVSTLVGSDTSSGTVLGTRTLELDLFIFRLGPTFFWDVSPDVGLSVSAGPAAALVSQTYSYNESVTSSAVNNRGSFSDSEFVFGAYLGVMGTYHVEENGDLYLGFQYLPLGSSSISESGREASLDFGGQFMISAGVSWTF